MYEIFIGLIGGLGLFLYGMKMMGEGLENIAGDKMKKIFEKITSHPLKGVATGTVVTAIIQSSSATTVMVVGFVNAGLMNLYQAASVIMGANIGTTITTQLISFKLDKVVPIFIAVGALMVLFSKRRKYKIIGTIILGFGILFLGLDIMKDSMKPLRDAPIFINMISSLKGNTILGVFVGALMTAVVQSSSASTGILVALAGTGSLPIEVAIPILFGNNIGTCVTALLSSIGTSKTARKAAVFHLVFNVVGTLVFIWAIPLLTDVVVNMNKSDVSRQIANAHTIFNITNTIIMIPFIKYLVALVNKILPGEDEIKEYGTKYIDYRLLETPVIAIGQSIQELMRMAEIAKENLSLSMKAFVTEDPKLINEVNENEKLINLLEHDITDFLVKISNTEISDQEQANIITMFNIVNDIERVGDHCSNLVELTSEKVNRNLEISGDALSELENMFKYTLDAYDTSIESFRDGNVERATKVLSIEERIDDLEEELREKHIKRLNRGICSANSGAVFLDMISNFERIGDHSVNIAEAVLKKD
ncbi:Na/Pi cotransporter family protein [Clostridium sediminicola]